VDPVAFSVGSFFKKTGDQEETLDDLYCHTCCIYQSIFIPKDGSNVDRFIQTANLYHRGIIKKIIVSGGTGSLIQKEPPEASYLRQQLIDNGVNPAAIYMDNRSRNTYENAVFSKTITDSLHLQPPFVLITSAIHMKRSKSVFTKAGVQFIAYPCDYKVYPLDYTFENTIVPRIELLNDWSYFIKEMVGLAVYKLTGKA
jgi:uncharacterized SAM-binding protein YcdF (DUF218 family)